MRKRVLDKIDEALLEAIQQRFLTCASDAGSTPDTRDQHFKNGIVALRAFHARARVVVVEVFPETE